MKHKKQENFIAPYLEVKEDLQKKIKKGKGVYATGERIPSEMELSRHYHVSRPTLKKALSLLVSEGYIFQIPGRGTFINSPDNEIFQRQIESRRQFKRMNKGIGVLVPCITESLYPGILRGIEDFCKKKGYHVILGNSDATSEKEQEYMIMFTERGVSGLIIAVSYQSHLNPYYATLKKCRIPFVLVDVSIAGIEADLVATDNTMGAYLGTRRLIEKGCKNIAFICGWKEVSSSVERLEGYQKALAEAGLPFQRQIVRHGEFSREFGYNAAMDVLAKNSIDSIFSANEPITLGVFRAVGELSSQISQKINIVSFDEPDVPPWLNNPVVLVSQPRYEIGQTAAQLLLERISKKNVSITNSYKRILLSPLLHNVNTKEHKVVFSSPFLRQCYYRH
ncbi:MAG: GntR family transcriptional regulator [Candidatus Omnitrophica bacterium]|nr:GntR family transcriptional regulator [Candidatus Omnitrophota bacterium]